MSHLTKKKANLFYDKSDPVIHYIVHFFITSPGNDKIVNGKFLYRLCEEDEAQNIRRKTHTHK